jgi:hypothetical protein
MDSTHATMSLLFISGTPSLAGGTRGATVSESGAMAVLGGTSVGGAAYHRGGR